MRITFYESRSGRRPVLEYIDAQSVPERARILAALHEIGTHGFEAVRVSFKPIREKLWEIRIQSERSHRIFYAVLRGEMVLFHAITKKTQKTPVREIEVALARLYEMIKEGS